MYNGTVGTAMEAEIFMAPVYMQSLKHQVIDKHRRARPRGRRRGSRRGRQDGGLRFEMKRDCPSGTAPPRPGRAPPVRSARVPRCTACGRWPTPGATTTDRHAQALAAPAAEKTRWGCADALRHQALQGGDGYHIAPLIRVDKASRDGAAIADAEIAR